MFIYPSTLLFGLAMLAKQSEDQTFDAVVETFEQLANQQQEFLEQGMMRWLQLWGLWKADLIELADFPRTPYAGKLPVGPADIIELYA